MWTVLITVIWLIAKDQQYIMANPIRQDLTMNSLIRNARAVTSQNLTKNPIENDYLVENWQDWILANLISVNYLNSLLVLTSRNDFAFTVPTNYRIKYVEDTSSFYQTIAQLATQMRSALSGAREDLNRVHTGMERVPDLLRDMAVYLKEAQFELLKTLFADSFNNIERLVNDSLIVLRKPEKNFTQVLNLLTEIDELLTIGSNDQIISLQVSDIKIQWSLLTELIVELAKRAETTRVHLLLQFNWVLQEFMRTGSSFPDSLRSFIISLLSPKIIEIERTSDLLSVITKTYTDISSQYTDDQIGDYAHLPRLPDEQKRQQYLNQFRHDLPPQVVQIARLALKQHKDFLRRDQNREANYEGFLANADITKRIR
jgi:hypothetical protein